VADGDKKLNLDMFAKPMGSVETSQGTVYIYSPTIDNYKFYSDLIEESAESRTQKVLPILISMIARTSFSEKFTPAPLEIYSRLSEADLNAIVDEFHKKLAEFRVKHPEKSCEVLEPRRSAESALVFFDRILEAESAYQKKNPEQPEKNNIRKYREPCQENF